MESKNSINFTKLKVNMSLKGDNSQEVDIAKQLGNIIFQSQSSIEAFRLANKVYDSEEIEYTEEELNMLAQVVNASDISLPFKRAIFVAMGKELQ